MENLDYNWWDSYREAQKEIGDTPPSFNFNSYDNEYRSDDYEARRYELETDPLFNNVYK